MTLRPFIATMLLLCAAHVQAASLRISSAFDAQSMDPHALALLYHSRVSGQIYEFLVNRDEEFRLEPALALSWANPNPTTWRFKLRPGVSFHDGTPFTADDVVFSIERTLAAPSQRAFQLKGVTGAKKIDDLTVDLVLAAPDAVLPEKMPQIGIMSRAWAVKHNVERAQDFNARQETYGVRNANGTGPFMLDRYEPDVRLLLKRNPRWWGWADKRHGNLQEAILLPLKSDATRIAALISGEVDVVLDPPLPDIERLKKSPQLTVLAMADLGQQYLAFDQARDELEGSDVKGKNPFKDIRVRRAVYHAVDVPLIVQKVLRGHAVPTGALLSPRVDGSPADLDRRLPFDPARARALLAEAGYPNGFAVTIDCVKVAWREAVCQAVTVMLNQVGIRATLRSSPTNQFFPKLSQGTGSLLEYGWTPQIDAWGSRNGLLRTWDKSGLGTFNAGRYSNARLDTLIDDIRTEPDLTRRRAMVGTVLRIAQDDLAYLPLYRRTLNWATTRKVKMVQWPNDQAELRWVRVQP